MSGHPAATVVVLAPTATSQAKIHTVCFNILKSKPFSERTLKREKGGVFFERQYEMS